MIKVKDVMTNDLVTVDPQATMREAADLLLEHEISGLPVVDGEQNLLGVVTEFDLLQLIYDPALAEDLVADHMTRNPIALDITDRLTDAADLFLSNPVRRFPVVEGKRLVGVISRHDLMRCVRSMRQQVASRTAVASAQS